VTFSSELKNGIIKFPGEGGQLRGIVLDIAYDGGERKDGKDSYLRVNLRNSSFQGNNLKSNLRLENLKSPVIDVDLKGSLPVSLLNLALDSTLWNFKEGLFDFDHFVLKGMDSKSFSTKSFIEKSAGKFSTKGVRFTYQKDVIEMGDGDIDLAEDGTMKLQLEDFTWNKAKGEDVEGVIQFHNDKVDFELSGNHSEGKVKSKGVLTGWGGAPVLRANWIVQGIEMDQLLSSFGDFDQTFITSHNLKGKANVWTETIIPYDKNGNIQIQDVAVKAAIEINDGQLQDMKILEDFSKYVHLDDLRDIRFNTFRNYLKIEKGNVYCPVVFIQSSAINLSVNGIHSFDQDILYNLKINAGQTASNKMKKIDFIKRVKQAKKSGWINLYFVLAGSTSDVKYEQNQKGVIASFEQSAEMKETLRNYLVDTFGHDVYWIEPNEWEDIPEYQ
ncbi:MAG: AsmA-like C-terminal region-containing protein, partial [Bacteroidota bacterium]|nr:AsmA-like C-terminal region-containing protein [Bacteroidota bacterium]